MTRKFCKIEWKGGEVKSSRNMNLWVKIYLIFHFFLLLLQVSCNHKRILSRCCWCITSLWCYSSCYIWKCGKMVEGASRPYRCQHCDHVSGKQGRPAPPASRFHWGCPGFCWTREHLFHGNICPRVHECWQCFHRSAVPNLSCRKQEGPWHWGRPSSLAQRTDYQCWRQGWCISCEESWMLLHLIMEEMVQSTPPKLPSRGHVYTEVDPTPWNCFVKGINFESDPYALDTWGHLKTCLC